MFKYEITFIIGENEKPEVVERELSALGAKITKTTDLGLKPLSYPIKKQISGHYFVTQFETEIENLKKLDDKIKHESAIIRYLVVKALRFPIQRTPKEQEKTSVKGGAAKSVLPAVEKIKTEEPILSKPAKEDLKQAQEIAPAIVEEKQPLEGKVAKSVKKAPARKKIAKPTKTSQAELDKKLEELTGD